MELVHKYPGLWAAIACSDSELRADLEHALSISAADPNSDIGVRAGKVAAWIGQALRMRTPGLSGPLT